MKKIYKLDTGLTKVKTNTKRYVAAIVSSVAIAGAAVVPAMAAPTTGPVSGPGCFGQWRAGSVQALNDAGYTVGRDFFSQRAGDNSTQNVSDKAACLPN